MMEAAPVAAVAESCCLSGRRWPCTIIAEQKHKNSLVSPCSQCCNSVNWSTQPNQIQI